MSKLDKLLTILQQRDGVLCYLCKMPNPNTIEHLNNDRKDNRLVNRALAHQSCNIIKRGSKSFRIIAERKLEENERHPFIPIEDETQTQIPTEMEISKNNFEIIEQYISEKISTDGSILFEDALNGGALKCRETTGYGSNQSVRNYLANLTSIEGKFMKTRDPSTKKKIIVKREGK